VSPAKIIAAAEASWTKKDNKLKPGPIYQNIDQYGDIIQNKGTTNKVTAVGYGGMGSPDWGITSYSKKAISSFVNYCRENEIQVFFTWPSTLKSKRFDLNNKIIQENLTKIKVFLNHLAVPVLGEPGDFYFERKYFFDTHYHLNQTGRDIRTRKLIKHLLLSLPPAARGSFEQIKPGTRGRTKNLKEPPLIGPPCHGVPWGLNFLCIFSKMWLRYK